MQNAAQQVVQEMTAGVDEGRFIAHIREMFSSSTIALSELAQNARRAQATQLKYDLSEGGKTLVVTDDGIGITDFPKLIQIAKSGWSQEIVDDEDPFGMGFYSVCFVADQVRVESNGKRAEFTADDLIKKASIKVFTGEFIGGTRITLSGFKLDKSRTEYAVRDLAKGFPIDVLLNGERMDRPHAELSMVGIDTAIGFVHIPLLHDMNSRHGFDLSAITYCQGLPVAVPVRSYFKSDDDAIVHLDHKRFRPRFPDRDNLIDGQEAAMAIREEMTRLVQQHLVDQKAKMLPHDFVNRYWGIAKTVDFLEVMNDVPVLPQSELAVIDGDIFQSGEGDSCWTCASSEVTREQVESGQAVLFGQDLTYDCDEDNFARMAFVAAKGWFLVVGLPSGHWASTFIKDIAEMECHVGGVQVASGLFEGRYVWGSRVTIVDGLSVTMNGETTVLSTPIAISMSDAGPDALNGILIPTVAQRLGSVLRQVSDYCDDRSFQEDAYEEDKDELWNLVTMLKGEKPAATLRTCLKGSPANRRTNLCGKTFTVSFDDKGNFQVVDA